MNIQIYGKSKCFDTKKAQRYFKERGISFQAIDLDKFGMSKGEYESVKRVVGSMSELVDEKSKEYEKSFMKYLSPEDQEEKLLENPKLFRSPIVRNGKQATIGYQPDVWAGWK